MSLLNRFSSLLALATFALTLSACSGTRPSLMAARPMDEPFRGELKKELSSLNVTVEAPTDELAKLLNQTVGKELYKGSTKTRGLTADVLRNGPIGLSAADNYIYFTLPVTMSLSYGMFETPAIPLKMKFRASPRISPDWKLSTDIAYTGLSDLLAEDLGIGPLSIKPRSVVEGIVQPLQKMLADTVNRKINEKLPLKAEIAKAWNAAQKPVLLDKGYSAWLKLAPREVLLSPLTAQNNRVKLNVGINSFAEVIVGPEPAAQPAAPLPNLKLVNNFDRNFRIALNADLFYRDILNAAAPLLLNKPIENDGKTVIIRELDIYGNGGNFIVKVATQGSLEGVFYLTGKPHFDPKTNIFSVEDVDFDMQTKSMLLNTADWFLHGTIKGMIQEKLNMDLTQRLEQSREMAGKAIKQVQLADHVLLKGSIKTLKFNDMLVRKDRISVQVYTEGESAISTK